MIIQRQVKAELNEFIDVLWYVDEDNLSEEKRDDIIVPSGHIHIVYNFGAPYYLIEGRRALEMPDMVLVGQFKTATQVRYGNNVRQLGIAIRPAALYAMFHKVSGMYTGAIVDCGSMAEMQALNRAVTAIVDQHPQGGEGLLNAVEAYFESLKIEAKDGQIYEGMVQYIEDHQGLIDVKDMAQNFGYSVSALERNFKKNLGLTPKAFADILRFRYAVMEEDPTVLFYDQSHFIKNCRRYTNKIPADLTESEEISLLYMLGLDKSKESC